MMSFGDLMREYWPIIGVFGFLAMVGIGIFGGKSGKGGGGGHSNNE